MTRPTLTLTEAVQAIRDIRKVTFRVPRKGFPADVRRGMTVLLRVPYRFEPGIFQALQSDTVAAAVVRRTASHLWVRLV